MKENVIKKQQKFQFSPGEFYVPACALQICDNAKDGTLRSVRRFFFKFNPEVLLSMRTFIDANLVTTRPIFFVFVIIISHTQTITIHYIYNSLQVTVIIYKKEIRESKIRDELVDDDERKRARSGLRMSYKAGKQMFKQAFVLAHCRSRYTALNGSI